MNVHGEYEYAIDLPHQGKAGIGESMASNQSSVGHYQNDGIQNINVKKSIIKMGSALPVNDIRERDMDMSPKSSKNEINFQNQNQAWKNQKY